MKRVKLMTMIQKQAIQLIQQLPDDKIQAIITLATDEIRLMHFSNMKRADKKKAAFHALEELRLDLPENFDADKELAEALEEKYGTAD